MSKELNLYNLNRENILSGGSLKKDNIDISFDNAVKKYRKKCLELKKENEELKKINIRLEKELNEYKKNK